MLSIEKYLSGLFLLILTTVGGFTSQTLGCSSRKFLIENHFSKQFILLFLIYFTLNFTNINNQENPIQKIKASIFLWLFFLIFTKLNIYFTGLIFFMLTILYILINYMNYYKEINTKESIEISNNIQKYVNIMQHFMFLFLIIGFIIYFLKQKREQKHFNYIYFFFGTRKCKHLLQ